MEPRVFIGCASESLPIAEYIQRQADSVATIHIWNQEIFKAGDYTLERLLNEYTEYDFAIFVIEPVDTAAIRGEEACVARDNVLFEAGLFFGHLGRERTLLVAPSSKTTGLRFHLPSDLTGLTLITYNPFSNARDLPAKLGPVCTTIKEIIKSKAELIDSDLREIMKKVSGGMIYILRHLEHSSLNMRDLTTILMKFNFVPNHKYNRGWEKAAQYAQHTLEILGLAESYNVNGAYFGITCEGKMLISDPKVQQLFKQEMSLPLLPL